MSIYFALRASVVFKPTGSTMEIGHIISNRQTNSNARPEGQSTSLECVNQTSYLMTSETPKYKSKDLAASKPRRASSVLGL